MSSDLVKLFESVGLSSQRAIETAANKKLSLTFQDAIIHAGVSDGTNKSTGSLLYHLASTVKGDALKNIPYIARAIKDQKLNHIDQVGAAIKFFQTHSIPNDELFNESCGVGVSISESEISEKIKSLLIEKKQDIELKKHAMLGPLLVQLKNELKWANTLLVKEQLEKQILELLGPKPILEKQPKNKSKEVLSPIESDQTPQLSMTERGQSDKFVFEGELARLHQPGGNPQINPEIMVEHLKRTGGRVITRFPPEPNGYEPDAIKYSSDYFQKLYDLAIELIKRDKAFVCHHTAEEMYEMRGGDSKGPRQESKWRNRPIEESLKEFQRMKQGEYEHGEAVLRMKMDMQNPNPQFWDLIAYRVLKAHHVRTGNEWCIYPTYDYTHCLCDSFEDITHSMCTTEFVLNRESYYWLVDALELYKPVQWEYGRLKLTNTVLSKRKLMKLVDEGIVTGWDDPRLFTLQALRRRGFTPEAINAFVRELGVTTANTTIPVERLEKYVREHLNESSPRIMAVLEPLKITLTNVEEDYYEEISVPNHPQKPEMGQRKVPFTRTLFIEMSDFREHDDPNFYRLAIGKSVGLLHVPFPIKATKIIRDPKGNIQEIQAVYEKDIEFKKPKSYIHWVSMNQDHSFPAKIQANLYFNLFLHADPDNKDQAPLGWFSDINPSSLLVQYGYADLGCLKLKPQDKVQFVRVGYFCVDESCINDVVCFNRTVGLKEDVKKDK